MEADKTCELCGADIVFVETDDGETMPFDAQPTKVYIPWGNRGVSEFGVSTAHVTHFATCPEYEN